MTSHDQPPTIALSLGEPAGIGPDIAIELAAENISARLGCIASPAVIKERAALLGVALNIVEYSSFDAIPVHRAGNLSVIPVATASAVSPGKLDAQNSPYVLRCLDIAIASARAGEVDCIVTGPVHKGIINDAGYTFSGHTEYLAAASDPAPVMMLATQKLRVALVTTHIPLRDVANKLETNHIRYVIETVATALRCDFGIAKPVLGVCGLNPHAGEGGHFGPEDEQIIAPAIAALCTEDFTVVGPLPADTAFALPMRDDFDCIVTMYHDQGLPVIKALAFGDVVNITLGLPLRRTSVDHGTALDMAGTGKANSASMRAAITEAIRFGPRAHR